MDEFSHILSFGICKQIQVMFGNDMQKSQFSLRSMEVYVEAKLINEVEKDLVLFVEKS